MFKFTHRIGTDDLCNCNFNDTNTNKPIGMNIDEFRDFEEIARFFSIGYDLIVQSDEALVRNFLRKKYSC